MQRSMSVRIFSCLLGFTIVCGSLCVTGCGEDMSEPKTITPSELPKDKAKESMQYYTDQMKAKMQKGAPKK
jgi:hypothetical protein